MVTTLGGEVSLNISVQYIDVMMSQASPAANSASAATGKTWFKIYEQAPVFENGALTFPSESQCIFGCFHFQLPMAF